MASICLGLNVLMKGVPGVHDIEHAVYNRLGICFSETLAISPYISMA